MDQGHSREVIVKKFPIFYGTRRFITAFTRVRHLSLTWARSIQSMTPNPTSLRSILILSSNLHLVLPSGLFPSGHPTKTLYAPLLSSIRTTWPANLLLDRITQKIFGEGYRSYSGPASSVGIANGYGLDGPGSNPGGGARFSAPVQTGPGAHPASCTIGTGSFLGAKSDRGVLPTTHPLLVPWSKNSRAIPLFPLWAVRSVQSLSAGTRVRFTILIQNTYSGR